MKPQLSAEQTQQRQMVRSLIDFVTAAYKLNITRSGLVTILRDTIGGDDALTIHSALAIAEKAFAQTQHNQSVPDTNAGIVTGKRLDRLRAAVGGA